MKIFLASAYERHEVLDAVRRLAARDSVGRHLACRTPEEADAVLFVENTQFDDLRFERLRRHPLVERHAGRAFMYSEADRPLDPLPGLYCSMPDSRYAVGRHVAVPYLNPPNPHAVPLDAGSVETRWLYSFMGSMSHPCRRAILALDDPDGHLVDTSDFDVWSSPAEELARRGRRYAETLAASRFVLCPRGIGTSSLRLFETLAAGRVPVIIADDWVPPPQVDWSFALRVAERRVSSIPGLLRALEDEAEERGRAAYCEWKSRFAPEVLFDTIGESIACLLETGAAGHALPRVSLAHWLRAGELRTREAMYRWRRQAQ